MSRYSSGTFAKSASCMGSSRTKGAKAHHKLRLYLPLLMQEEVELSIEELFPKKEIGVLFGQQRFV